MKKKKGEKAERKIQNEILKSQEKAFFRQRKQLTLFPKLQHQHPGWKNKVSSLLALQPADWVTDGKNIPKKRKCQKR